MNKINKPFDIFSFNKNRLHIFLSWLPALNGHADASALCRQSAMELRFWIWKHKKLVYWFALGKISLQMLKSTVLDFFHARRVSLLCLYGIASSICSLSGRCRTEIRFATCVDRQGKRYNIELDNIRGFEDDFEK